jgi:hypothetical protein
MRGAFPPKMWRKEFMSEASTAQIEAEERIQARGTLIGTSVAETVHLGPVFDQESRGR